MYRTTFSFYGSTFLTTINDICLYNATFAGIDISLRLSFKNIYSVEKSASDLY